MLHMLLPGGEFLESLARDYTNLGPLSGALGCRLQMQLLDTDEGLSLMRVRVMPKDDKNDDDVKKADQTSMLVSQSFLPFETLETSSGCGKPHCQLTFLQMGYWSSMPTGHL